jgi:hypothetical protein
MIKSLERIYSICSINLGIIENIFEILSPLCKYSQHFRILHWKISILYILLIEGLNTGRNLLSDLIIILFFHFFNPLLSVSFRDQLSFRKISKNRFSYICWNHLLLVWNIFELFFFIKIHVSRLIVHSFFVDWNQRAHRNLPVNG